MEYPSCLQTTRASGVPQKSSHTVPHWELRQISTLPWVSEDPPTNLIAPKLHTIKHTFTFNTPYWITMQLTSTGYTSIFIMSTVMWLWMWTGQQSLFITRAVNIVQLNWSSSLTKVCPSVGTSIYIKLIIYQNFTWSDKLLAQCMQQLYSFMAKIQKKIMLYIYNSSLVDVYPSCLQTTWASGVPQESSQTVPHCELRHISTLPWAGEAPPTSCSAPELHTIRKHKR